MISLLLFLVASTAPAKLDTLACPAAPPTSWTMPHSRLESIRVLSFPPDQPPVEGEALPMMAPFSEWEKDGVLYQTWSMNFDAPGYKFQVDCLYTGTDRVLHIDAPNVKKCTSKLVLRTHALSFKCR